MNLLAVLKMSSDFVIRNRDNARASLVEAEAGTVMTLAAPVLLPTGQERLSLSRPGECAKACVAAWTKIPVLQRTPVAESTPPRASKIAGKPIKM